MSLRVVASAASTRAEDARDRAVLHRLGWVALGGVVLGAVGVVSGHMALLAATVLAVGMAFMAAAWWVMRRAP